MKTFKDTIKLTFLASSLALATMANANPCDNFKIKLKNNLPHDLLIKTMTIEGAQIQPQGIQKIDPNSEGTFTVTNTIDSGPMRAVVTLNSISLPSKVFKVRFNLTNEGLICSHDEISREGDLTGTSTRLPGEISYSIK